MTQDASTERQAQRLATLASLARPVQHEINNLLTVVFANLELLKRSAAAGAPQRQLDRIQQATVRLEVATRAILALSRRPVPEPAEVAPLTALQALTPLLHLVLPAPGALALELPEADPWTVQLDRAALDEALVMLAREAAATMPRGTTLGLALVQQDGVVSLTVTWPDRTAAPSTELMAALAALSAGPMPEGQLALHWPRAVR